MKLSKDIIDRISNQKGIELDHLPIGTKIEAQTENTLYKFEMLGRGKSLIEGGSRFPTPTEAIVIGSTFGGSLIRVRYMAVGMYIEIDRIGEGKLLITSMVKKLKIIGPDGSWDYKL